MQPVCYCVGGSSSVGLDECPDVVQILKNDSLRQLKVPLSQRSVQIPVVRTELRTNWDVATFNDQGPREGPSSSEGAVVCAGLGASNAS